MVVEVIVTTRATQQAARYLPVGGLERCAYCRFYSAPGNCGRILGPVSPAGWCRFFSRMVWLRMDGGDTDMAVASGPAPPTIDLQFTTMSSLPASVTLSRASIGTYFNSTGTMQTAAANVARFDYNPTTLAANGLLIEEARTNSIPNSTTLTTFTPAAGTWVTGATVAPDGTTTGALFREDTTGNSHLINVPSAVTSGVQWTYSIYAKAAGRSFFFANGAGMGAASLRPEWNLTAGTDTTTGSNANFTHGIQNVGNGWYRCWFSWLTTNTTGIAYDLELSAGGGGAYAGNGTSGIYFWGGQAEQAAGPFVTSYIPTTGTTVTRAADVATIASLPGRNAAAESYAAEFTLAGVNAAANPRIVGGSATQLGPLFVNTTLHGSTTDLVGTVATANTLTLGAVSKLAGNWASPNAGRVCLNAGTVAGATTLTTGYGAMTVPKLMGDSVAADQATGWMRRFRYWPRALADTELQSVTT